MGDQAMTLQISKLILYSRRGEVREVAFTPGRLNILTGASKSGKSAIIDIIDYCTGRSECNVADGVIRKYVGWYAILFQLGLSQVFLARRNPDVGDRTSSDIFMDRGTAIAVPPASALFKNTTVSTVENFLGAAIGISQNEHRPPRPTRDPLEANFRHAILFSFQDQNDIDSKRRLFHRQDEDFIGQAIKDTLPYFLGAVDEDRLLKQAQYDLAKKQLRQLERQAQEQEVLDGSTFPRAQSLISEAKQVGLTDDRTVAASYETALAVLQRISRQSADQGDLLVADGEDLLAELRAERQGLRADLERINSEVRATRTFTGETAGYEREAKEQRARLSAVDLIAKSDSGFHTCPVCESHLANPTPTALQIERSLRALSDQLEAVEAENPRLHHRLISLQTEGQRIEEKLRTNQQQIMDRIRENEVANAQKDFFILRARTIGKISQYLDTASKAENESNLRNSIELARARLLALERELDADTVRERLNTFLNIIGKYMTEYSHSLDLEHTGSQLRLDIRGLTVIADTLDGPVPLFRMGSGENWVGYHVLAHLALHKWFRQKGRPVPAFIIFDQPSQAHYPPEKDADGSIDVLGDEDQTAVLKLFKLISDASNELAPDLQIIVMDHADLKRDWFESAVVERWRNGNRLVPTEWQT
jgi:hypothetical protein